MAHYISMGGHGLFEDADDLRGSLLYGHGSEPLGKISDVIFDHQSGEIRYLVVDTGKRKVGVPADYVFRTPRDEESFSVDMNEAQFEALPTFKDEYLQNEQRWEKYHGEQEKELVEWRKEMEGKYKEGGWREAPIQHRQGSTHNITPEPGEVAAAGRQHAPVLERNRPESGFGSLGEEVEVVAEGQSRRGYRPSPRFQAFANVLRKNRVDVAATCGACQPKKAA